MTDIIQSFSDRNQRHQINRGDYAKELAERYPNIDAGYVMQNNVPTAALEREKLEAEKRLTTLAGATNLRNAALNAMPEVEPDAGGGAVAADPNDIFDPNAEIQEDALYTKTPQGQDFAAASRVIYNKMFGQDSGSGFVYRGMALPMFSDREVPQTDEDFARFGVEFMGQFNYNISKMGADFVKMRGLDENTALAFYSAMTMYDRLPDFTWNGTKRMTQGILSDPTTIAGLGTLGWAFLGRAGAKQTTKTAFKEYLKSALASSTAVGAIEGGVYGGLDNYFRQQVAVDAEIQDGINLSELGTAATVGTLAGGVLGKGSDLLGDAVSSSAPVVQDALVSAGEAADDRIAARAADTGVTMNMGVDPVALADPLISAAGRAVKPELNQVLDVMAEQMKLPPADRVQPSGSGSIFELTPEAYERIEFEQKETPVPRAPEGKKLPLNNRGAAVVNMSDRISDVLAERAKPYIGNNVQFFYHTGPLIEKAMALGIPENEARKQLKMFALNYAATSPRTQTEPNLKNASLVSAKQKAGIDVREIVGPGGEGINEKGYPMIINEGGLHLKLIGDAAGDGIDPNVNPKPATFAENVSGNLAGVTVDTHAIRAVLDAMNEIEPGSIPKEFIGGKTAAITKKLQAQYAADPSSFNAAKMVKDTLGSQKIDGVSKQTEYAVFSDIYKMVAEKIGVQPAEAQSLSWFANGDRTGLGSAPKTIVELIEDRIDVTAQLLGQTKDEVFKKFMQGSVPLLSIGGGMALMETGTMQDSE